MTFTRLPLTTRLRDERGQSAVEFGLMMPIVLVLIYLIVQFGLLVIHWNNVTQLAGNAARYAAVDKDPNAIVDKVMTGINNVQVCVTFPVGPLGTTKKVGDPVRIDVKGNHKWLPLVSSVFGSSFQLKSKATMRLERPSTIPIPVC
jgi:Flp pilus assembly protein TadG